MISQLSPAEIYLNLKGKFINFQEYCHIDGKNLRLKDEISQKYIRMTYVITGLKFKIIWHEDFPLGGYSVMLILENNPLGAFMSRNQDQITVLSLLLKEKKKRKIQDRRKEGKSREGIRMQEDFLH